MNLLVHVLILYNIISIEYIFKKYIYMEVVE